MPRGHEHDPIYSHQYLRELFRQFLPVFLEKDCNEKKDRCAVFGCDDDRLFDEKYTLSSLFARKPRVHPERVPPGHHIILLKSFKFNMAAVSVKRSIMRINLLGTF